MRRGTGNANRCCSGKLFTAGLTRYAISMGIIESSVQLTIIQVVASK